MGRVISLSGSCSLCPSDRPDPRAGETNTDSLPTQGALLRILSPPTGREPENEWLVTHACNGTHWSQPNVVHQLYHNVKNKKFSKPRLPPSLDLCFPSFSPCILLSASFILPSLQRRSAVADRDSPAPLPQNARAELSQECSLKLQV